MLKKILLILALIPTLAIAESGTISQLNPWISSTGYVKVSSTTAGVWIPSLGAPGNPCVIVGTTGKLSTSACGSGSQTPWTSNINGGGFSLTNAVIPDYLSLSSWYATTTDGLDEGLTNLYFTNPRVQTYLDTLSKGYFFSTTSSDYWYTQQSKASSTLLGDANTWSSTQTFGTITASTGTIDHLITDELTAKTSGGSTFRSANGTPVSILGVGNSANVLFYGGVNIDGAVRMATSLNGLALLTNGAVTSIATSSLGLLTTDVAEGTNLYFTNPRVQTYLDALSKGYFFSTTSADYWMTTQSIPSASSTIYADNGTFSGLNTFADISFTNATGSNVTSSVFCLIGDTCISAWPTGGSGSVVGTVATSTSETANQVPFYTSTNGYPALLGTDATFTFDSGTQRLSATNIDATNALRTNLITDSTGVGTEIGLSTTDVTIGVQSGAAMTIVDLGTGYRGALSPSTLTANRTYQLPDIDGTLVTDGDISTLVPYSGATGNLDMGTWNVTTPQINSVDTPLLILGSDSPTLDTPGNTITVRGGKGNGTGDGAYAYVVGGDSGDTEGIGGGVGLMGGYSYGASHGGNIELSVGGSATGDNGKFIFNQNVVGGALGVLDFSLLGTSEKTFQFPNQSGTLALLSDISGATASSTLHADFNTFSGDNTFTGTSTIQKIFGKAGEQIDPWGGITNDYSLLIYGGFASTTVLGGSKHGNTIKIQGGDPANTIWGDYASSPDCTHGDGCYGGNVEIYGGTGIYNDAGSVSIYGGSSSSTVPNSGGSLSMSGGEGYNASNGGYFNLTGGESLGTGDGGSFYMSGGYSTLGSGGILTLTGGEGDNNGGEVLIKGGQTNTSGNAGNVVLRGGDAFGSGLVGGVVIKTSTLSNVVEFATTTTGTNYFYNPLSVLSTASSTFANGIDIASGCFSINGVCVGGGSSSAVGGSGAIQFANGTAFNGDNATFAWDNTNKKLGVGTSTPYATLSVQGKFGGINDLFVISTTTSSTGESFKLMSMAMNGKVYIHEKKATTTKSYTLNDPASIPSITAANYGAYFSDDLTRVLECGTAAASNIQLRNGGFANASQQYVGTTAQTITWTKLYNSVVVGRGCITYGGYHYVLYASTTNAASTAIRRSIAADWNDIAASANWATATISGVALPTTAFLVGAEGGNIYIASTTNAVQKYIIATSTNTLTSSTYIPLTGANVLINNTRVNSNGIYVGFSAAPFVRKYTLAGTAVSGVTNIGVAVPSTTGPDLFVTENSLYGLMGNSTTLLTRIIGY